MALKKLLSIDGGGVRGLAAIVVLETIMDAANGERRRNNLPQQEPWEMFDMIGGTNTGGLIAIMLGRLHMSLNECKEAYMTLSRKAFSQRHILAQDTGFAGLGPNFETQPLEEAITEVLDKAQKHLGDSSANALLKEDNAACKVLVVSHLQNDGDQATILRSYQNFEKPAESTNTMKIWQACRATSAVTTFYKPLNVDGITYSDGGLVYNNPVSLVHAEGGEMFREHETLLISLGVGIASDEEYIPNLSTITNQLVDLATRTQREADTFIRREAGMDARAGRYFRFDVPGVGDIGLEEADKLLQIELASEIFFNNPEVGMKVKSCSEQLALGLDPSIHSSSEICQSLELYAANPRQDTIPLAHSKSFQWIWDSTKHSFVPWLKSGSDIFWIFGKPASGKSTLMKFLFQHNHTREILESQGEKYSICQYFFYELSELETQQETSMAGLLHAILFQLLQVFPDLIQTICQLYRKKVHLHKTTGTLVSPWTIEILKDALMSLVTSPVAKKVCLFIDGFDECREGGKCLDFLTSWLRELTRNGHIVKICLSSRDLPPIRERFNTHLSLELHLFTRNDIAEFVTEELMKTKTKSISLDGQGHETITKGLIKSVVNKAQGVFVWVRLVVADLVSGLESAEDEASLKVRLDSLPSELEDLYSHIISCIPSRDLHTAFKYFQLLLRAPGKTCTLTLLQFLMAVQNPKKCLQNLDEPGSIETSPEQILEKLALLKDHLRARCRNLIQVQTRRFAPRRWERIRRENATFIHLTFKEYISRDSVQQGIKERIKVSNMPIVPTADLLLIASCLLLLKTQRCYIPHWIDNKPIKFHHTQDEKSISRRSTGEISERPQTPTLHGEVENEDDEEEYMEEVCKRAPDNLIAKFFNYACNLEHFFQDAGETTCHIDELDRYLMKVDERWASKFYARRTLQKIPELDVLCLAVCWKLKYYVEKKVKEPQQRKKRRPPLLFYAMNPPGWTHEKVDLDLLEILLKAGARTNESYNYNGVKKTTWEHTIQHFLRIGSMHPLQDWQKVIELMLKYRADPNKKIYLRDGSRYTTILHLLIDQYGKAGKDRESEAGDALLLLLKHGAREDNEDSEHISAFNYAQNECPALAEMIQNF